MAGRRGWRGQPPLDDADARGRIVQAARRCIDRHGAAKTGLADVAAEVGVTRQTVYRHFASVDTLFEEVAISGAGEFLEEVAVQVSGITDPAEVVVEAVASAVERLPKDRYIGLLLDPDRSAMWWRGVTSPTARRFGRSLLERTGVDWDAIGFSPDDLEGLVEVALRLLASLAAEPDPHHRDGEPLRAFLRAWLAPAVRHHMHADSPRRRKK